MKQFTVKLKPFDSVNAGGEYHNKLIQPELQRQQMLDKTEALLQLYDAKPGLHHKQELRKVCDIDGKRTQQWHYNKIKKNLKGRRTKPNYLIYEADVLRHNNLLEDLIKQLESKGNTDQQLLQVITSIWINMKVV